MCIIHSAKVIKRLIIPYDFEQYSASLPFFVFYMIQIVI